MDRNRNHFPTLLFICILTSILLYLISNIISFIHQRKTTNNARTTSSNTIKLSPESVNEEEKQMDAVI
jgi:hypothetical protein